MGVAPSVALLLLLVVFISTILRLACCCRSCERVKEEDKNFFTRIGGGSDAPANARFGNVNFGSNAFPSPPPVVHFFETTSTHTVANVSLSFASLVAVSNIALAATSTTSSLNATSYTSHAFPLRSISTLLSLHANGNRCVFSKSFIS